MSRLQKSSTACALAAALSIAIVFLIVHLSRPLRGGPARVAPVDAARSEVPADGAAASWNGRGAREAQDAAELPVEAAVPALEGASVQGIVTGSGGAPLAGARVAAAPAALLREVSAALHAAALEASPEDFGRLAAEARARLREAAEESVTDGSGRFFFKDLPREEVGVVAAYPRHISRASGPLLVAEGRTREVAIELIPAEEVTGRVLDAGGHPLRGAVVAVLHKGIALAAGEALEVILLADASESGEAILSAGTSSSNPDGSFSLFLPGPGLHRVAAWVSGWDAAIKVVEAGSSAVELRLERSPLDLGTASPGMIPRVAGRVVDELGAPIDGACVRLEQPGEGRRARGQVEVRTDALGRFSMEVRGHGPFDVSASSGRHAPGLVRGVLPGLELEVALGEGASLGARVVDDATDLPVAGATVVLELDGMAWKAASDAAGAVELRGLPPLESLIERFLAVEISAEGRATVTLPLPASAFVGPPVFRIASRPAVRGIVTDAAGRPVEGACVEVGRPRAPREQRAALTAAAFTGVDGRFEALLDGTLAVAVRVDVHHPGFAPWRGLLDGVEGAREARIEVTLDSGADVRGKVHGPGDEPVAGAWIEVFLEEPVGQGPGAAPPPPSMSGDGAGDPAARTRTDAEGSFHLSRLPAGRVSVRVSARGYARLVESGLRLDLGVAREELEFQLEPGREAEVDAASRDMSLASGADAFERPQANTEARGGEAEARAGGIVLDGTGAPVAGADIVCIAEVTAEEDLLRPRTGSTDPEGLFRIDGLAPGRYRLEARHPRFLHLEPRVVEVAAGEEAFVELQVAGKGVLQGAVVGLPGGGAEQTTFLLVRSEDPAAGGFTVPITSEGAFEAPVAAGRYVVDLHGATAAPVAVEVTAGARVTIEVAAVSE